ncbi:MAG TPA: class II histone deacetylase [Steroidobacteraceae bacterium]|nr:class II histone deacetylase [Steroidobacteraceae bacterium]
MRHTGLVSHERYFWHDPGTGAGFDSSSEYVEPDQHPESPSTKRRLLSLLAVSGLLETLEPLAPRLARIEELTLFHTPRYVEMVRALSEAGGGTIGDSATIGHGSFDIARLAAGGCLAAVDAVLTGKVSNAYALVRPPGHHAEPDRGRGYCVFGNAVLAVKHAQRAHRLHRIAVVDWDVHHGNGTELAFLDDPSVLTISVHQDRCYPLDSGFLEVVGEGRATHTNLNVPLPPGSGHGAYLAAFERAVIPALLRFGPQLVVVCSGLDASAMDPIGRMLATSETYRTLTKLVMGAAETLCEGRIVAVHEGGYSNAYVPFCGLAVIEEMARHRTPAGDPYLDEFMSMAGHELMPHQEAIVNAAAAQAERTPRGA